MTLIIDAKGLACPLPILRAKKALRQIGIGGLLAVYATDPGSVRDFQSFCAMTGDELVESVEEEPGVYRYLIRRRK
jgi:tRNA 2-thiouridine synthesizing protein A